MNLPSAEEYIQIIEKKSPGSLAMLQNHRFLKDDGKRYFYKKGEKTIVFKTQNPSGFYAVRFFLHDDPELFARYHKVQDYLRNKPLSWKVAFEFLDKEYYPAVQMDWIDSLSFSQYLDLIISDPSRISQLQSSLINLSRSLEENGIGHGDPNLDHVRFVKQGQEYIIKLIDYDSMFIPSFIGKDSLSAGTASFQHPMRLASDFSETIDRFSFWVFLTALEAFKTNPSLWTKATENGYDQSKQLLFNFRDLAFPQQSAVFQLLKTYNSKALNFYSDKLIEFCNYKSLEGIEAPRLFQEGQMQERKNEKAKEAIPDSPQKEAKPLPATPPPDPYKKTTNLPDQEERKEKKVFEKEIIHLKVKSEPQQAKTSLSVKKNKTGKIIALVFIVILVILTSAYFVSQSRPSKTSTKTVSTPKTTNSSPLQQKPVAQETVFTSANITQFLFQLYQSYNKRDLHAILSNYSDSLSQYYDAGAVTKPKLADLIKDLFIKPAFYECQPDLRTLQSEIQGGTCKLTVAVKERIKPDRKSKTESYSSKIEYTVDSTFKILAEKNIE